MSESQLKELTSKNPIVERRLFDQGFINKALEMRKERGTGKKGF
jgi:hypothetical protein